MKTATERSEHETVEQRNQKETETGTVCFSIAGEWFTQLVRSLWALEGKPDKALTLLADAFPTMREPDRIAICTGSLQLVGNSRDEDGIGLVEDDATEIHGMPLSLVAITEGFRKKIDRQQDEYQLATGEKELVASSKGLVAIPLRKKAAYYREDVNLEDLPHYEVESPFTEPSRFSTPRAEEEPEVEEPQSPPPEPRDSIATDCGWLAPDGRFYPCGWQEHLWLVSCFDLTGERAEAAGWIKISDKEAWSTYHVHGTGAPPTQRQIDLVFDWYNKKGRRLPHWISGADED